MSQIGEIMDELYAVVEDRKAHPKNGSYTNYLFDKGIDKICKKLGEEATEVVIAAKNNSPEETIYELADLLYHLTVLMVNQELSMDELYLELKKRRPS